VVSQAMWAGLTYFDTSIYKQPTQWSMQETNNRDVVRRKKVHLMHSWSPFNSIFHNKAHQTQWKHSNEYIDDSMTKKNRVDLKFFWIDGKIFSSNKLCKEHYFCSFYRISE